MEKLTTIQRIKEMLELDKVSISFKEAVLDNGIKVKTEGDFVVGATVYVVDEAGVETLAPDADHIVPELNVVVTTVNGVITEINEITAQVEEEQSTDETLAVTPEEQTAIISEVMLILDPRFAEIMLRLDELEARLNEGGMLSKDVESLKAQVEAFSKLPGGVSKTVIDEPTKKNRESLENKLERFKRITKK